MQNTYTSTRTHTRTRARAHRPLTHSKNVTLGSKDDVTLMCDEMSKTVGKANKKYLVCQKRVVNVGRSREIEHGRRVTVQRWIVVGALGEPWQCTKGALHNRWWIIY